MDEPLLLRWYALARDSPADLALRWLAVCREHLPDAAPVRYDDGEPLRRRLGPGGDPEFARFVDRTQGLVITLGTGDGLGSITGGVPTPRWGPVRVVTLSVSGDEALPLFVAAASELGVLYAHAVPQPGRSTYLAPVGRWRGLPRQAPRWSWFGPRYARLTRRHPAGGELAGGGVLHRTDVTPGSTWVPSAWQVPDSPDLARRAPRMPDGLRRPWGR